MKSPSGTIDVQEEMSDTLTVHKNLGQEIIVTTEDKVRLCLMRHKNSLRTKNEWITPLGILITLVVALGAADFKKFIVNEAVWEALFIISTVISFGWLIYSAYRAWVHRSGGDINGIISELKSQQIIPGSEPNRAPKIE